MNHHDARQIGFALYQCALDAISAEHPEPHYPSLPAIRGTMCRLRREELGLSQVAVAEAAGDAVNQQMVSRVEKGWIVQPGDDVRVGIAKALGLPASVLFLYADEVEQAT